MGIAGLQADEMIDAVQPHKPDQDKVDGNDEVQQPRHNQDQDAGNEGNDRRNVRRSKGHNDLRDGGIKRLPRNLLGSTETCVRTH